jgi:hypothetical protein
VFDYLQFSSLCQKLNALDETNTCRKVMFCENQEKAFISAAQSLMSDK